MKVLHVVQSLDPKWGGMASVLPELAAGLAALGVESRIASLAGGRYGSPPTLPGVDVQTFAASDGPLGRSREFSRSIDRLIADADVLHLHGLWTHQNWSAGKAARRRGKPYIMTPHSMMMPWAWQRRAWKKRPVGWLFEHKNLRRAACLHALAPGEAAAIRALGFNDRIETVPNGLWPEAYASLPAPTDLLAAHPHLADVRWMLFLSRFAMQKGVVPMLQAAFEVAGVRDDWHLVIAGPGDEGLLRVARGAIERKRMADRVTFLGMLSRPQVLQALGRCDILVQPSLSEGLSMSILEALAAGRPVLISPGCNMPEVKEADAGRIVEPTRRTIAAALRELVTMSQSELAAMGRRGQRLVEDRFHWKHVLQRYVAMYERVTKK